MEGVSEVRRPTESNSGGAIIPNARSAVSSIKFRELGPAESKRDYGADASRDSSFRNRPSTDNRPYSNAKLTQNVHGSSFRRN